MCSTMLKSSPTYLDPIVHHHLHLLPKLPHSGPLQGSSSYINIHHRNCFSLGDLQIHLKTSALCCSLNGGHLIGHNSACPSRTIPCLTTVAALLATIRICIMLPFSAKLASESQGSRMRPLHEIQLELLDRQHPGR